MESVSYSLERGETQIKVRDEPTTTESCVAVPTDAAAAPESTEQDDSLEFRIQDLLRQHGPLSSNKLGEHLKLSWRKMEAVVALVDGGNIEGVTIETGPRGAKIFKLI